jgi:decaprenylphospho-beta-D-erythro-pentofuranosid-2-ulose 2-reductase
VSESVSSAVVVGASSGVGRALAAALAKSGHALTVVARSARDLEATAADLRLRFDITCHAVVQDIGAAAFDVDAFARRCATDLGSVDCLLVPAGASSTEDAAGNPASVLPMVTANYVGPARLAAAFGRLMAERGRGVIVLFSSIAAAAPRSRNAAYSAAKAALEVYAKALRVELEPHGVRVVVIALGYVDTRLSFGMKLLFPVASPEAVAAFVLSRAMRVAGKSHFPQFWWWVTIILRHLPWILYRRLKF